MVTHLSAVKAHSYLLVELWCTSGITGLGFILTGSVIGWPWVVSVCVV